MVQPRSFRLNCRQCFTQRHEWRPVRETERNKTYLSNKTRCSMAENQWRKNFLDIFCMVKHLYRSVEPIFIMFSSYGSSRIALRLLCSAFCLGGSHFIKHIRKEHKQWSTPESVLDKMIPHTCSEQQTLLTKVKIFTVIPARHTTE